MLTRLYVVQGVSSKRHAGLPSARVEVPLLPAPGPARPGATAPTWDETSVTVTLAAAARRRSDEAPGVLYNVYAVARRRRIRRRRPRRLDGAGAAQSPSRST